MNILDKVKLTFKSYGFIQAEIKEAQLTNESGTPGYKTTEFWMNLLGQVGVFWGAVQGFVPPKIAAIVSIGGIALYTIARTISKAVSDIQAARASSTTVTTTAPVTTVTTP